MSQWSGLRSPPPYGIGSTDRFRVRYGASGAPKNTAHSPPRPCPGQAPVEFGRQKTKPCPGTEQGRALHGGEAGRGPPAKYSPRARVTAGPSSAKPAPPRPVTNTRWVKFPDNKRIFCCQPEDKETLTCRWGMK